MHIAFVVRMTWEELSQSWRIQLTSTNGDHAQVFCDAESLYLYIDRQMQAVRKAAHCPQSGDG